MREYKHETVCTLIFMHKEGLFSEKTVESIRKVPLRKKEKYDILKKRMGLKKWKAAGGKLLWQQERKEGKEKRRTDRIY